MRTLRTGADPALGPVKHRVIDGYHGAKLAGTFRAMLADPARRYG